MSVFDRLQSVLEEEVGNLADVMEYIGIFQSRIWFTKMLQQYELFKMAIDRPGHIVELGVYKGESFFNWARFVEIFNMGERETRVIGFDTFEGFPELHAKDMSASNQAEAGQYAVTRGGFNAGQRAYDRIMKLIDVFEDDHFVPQKKRLEIIKGDICQTVPAYVQEHPGLRIALLHLDCDLYEPTLAGLKHLYPRVVPGGVVVLDEYGQEKFAGESAAFDEYFGDSRPPITKSRLNSNPSAWFIKEG
jgi:hypothetical protein